MLDGMPILSSPMLAGVKHGFVKDGKLVVSPAFLDLLLKGDQRERLALLESLKAVNFDPPRRSTQWMLDTMQIVGAQMRSLAAPAQQAPAAEEVGNG